MDTASPSSNEASYFKVRDSDSEEESELEDKEPIPSDEVFKRLVKGFIPLAGPSGGMLYFSPPDGHVYTRKDPTRLMCVYRNFFSYLLLHLPGCVHFRPKFVAKRCNSTSYEGHTHSVVPIKLFLHNLLRWLVRIFYSMDHNLTGEAMVRRIMQEWPFEWDFNPRNVVARSRDIKQSARTKCPEKVPRNPLLGEQGLAAFRRVLQCLDERRAEISTYWKCPPLRTTHIRFRDFPSDQACCLDMEAVLKRRRERLHEAKEKHGLFNKKKIPLRKVCGVEPGVDRLTPAMVRKGRSTKGRSQLDTISSLTIPKRPPQVENLSFAASTTDINPPIDNDGSFRDLVKTSNKSLRQVNVVGDESNKVPDYQQDPKLRGKLKKRPTSENTFPGTEGGDSQSSLIHFGDSRTNQANKTLQKRQKLLEPLADIPDEERAHALTQQEDNKGDSTTLDLSLGCHLDRLQTFPTEMEESLEKRCEPGNWLKTSEITNINVVVLNPKTGQILLLEESAMHPPEVASDESPKLPFPAPPGYVPLSTRKDHYKGGESGSNPLDSDSKADDSEGSRVQKYDEKPRSSLKSQSGGVGTSLVEKTLGAVCGKGSGVPSYSKESDSSSLVQAGTQTVQLHPTPHPSSEYPEPSTYDPDFHAYLANHKCIAIYWYLRKNGDSFRSRMPIGHQYVNESRHHLFYENQNMESREFASVFVRPTLKRNLRGKLTKNVHTVAGTYLLAGFIAGVYARGKDGAYRRLTVDEAKAANIKDVYDHAMSNGLVVSQSYLPPGVIRGEEPGVLSRK